MNLENFYIVATDPEVPALQVNISGPYLTRKAAQADMEAAIDEAAELDPSARLYQYRICNPHPFTHDSSCCRPAGSGRT